MSCCILHVSPSLSDSGLNIKGKTVSDILACLREVIGNANKHIIEALPTVSGAAAHLHLKGQTQNSAFNPQKVTTLTCYIKISVGYFELKLHIHTLGTSDIYFTSCETALPPL